MTLTSARSNLLEHALGRVTAAGTVTIADGPGAKVVIELPVNT